ncbi:hypothetical protein OEA41_007379 [Lepraria neglecta]|uniref:Uncharacterized protein n=1 Tax=Lepraria neglecta TaxID=209136 RepID=A0AAD9ZD09_9LECA|nr:hypothetical protein OEA41_007379 [Lepraria neglecta]
MKTSKSQVATVTGPDIQPDAKRKVEDDTPTSIREPYTAANVKMLPEGFDDDSCDDVDVEVIDNALDNEGCRDEPLLWKDLPEEVTIITARGGQEGSPEARFEFLEQFMQAFYIDRELLEEFACHSCEGEGWLTKDVKEYNSHVEELYVDTLL